MSRRKQQKPRHLEAENDLAAILEDGAQSRFPSSPGLGDAHVCGKCRAEFLDLTDFLSHKKNCSQKRIVVMYDDEKDQGQGQGPTQEDEDVEGSSSPKGLVNGDYLENTSFDAEDHDKIPDSDAEETLDIMTSDKYNLADNKSDAGSNDLDGGSVSAADIVDDEDDEAMEEGEDEMDVDIKAQGKEPSPKDIITNFLKPELLPQMFQFPFPTLGMPDNNVKLASLEGTKVAMAQFAENNLANLPPNTDVATLQTMLYSLHQQQILQLQLLQQLQQQLMAGMAPSMASSLEAQGMGQYLLPQTTPSVGAAAPSVLSQPASTTTVTTSTPHSTDSSNGKKTAPAPTSAEKPILPPPATSSRPDVNSTTSTSTPTTSTPFSVTSTTKSFMNSMAMTSMAMSSMADASRMSQLFLQGKIPEPPSPLPPTPTPSSVPEIRRPLKEAGTVLDRSQYAADDPFFKHKCRFCHKVFGSDSGLQIHIRSHTGERPFKCNICGNRFSTRGNLKVHFARHKEKYPHVKMNPHPVPEHLDRLPNNPVLIAPVPAMVDRDRLPHPPPPVRDMKPEPATHLPAHTPEARLSAASPATSIAGSSSPTPAASEAPASSSPNVSDTAAMSSRPVTSTADISEETNTSTISNTSAPTSSAVSPNSTILSSTPLPMSMSSAIMTTPPGQMIPAIPMMSPGMPPMGFHESPFFQSPGRSILPTKEEDPMEQYMEIDKSETTKLQQLVENIETKLTDPNQCAICHRILSCKSALQMHYRTHTGERPFKCKICGRAFTTKGNLKTHMGVHRAKPPMRMLHQCPVCHKQFTNALVLQQHIRMHTGEIHKEMPPMMPGASEMMPGPYLPFPGFPFMPPMYPHPGGHHLQANNQMGNSGELDLRKPTPRPEDLVRHEAGAEKKEREGDKMPDLPGSEDNMSNAGSSNNENFSAEGSELGEKIEKGLDQPMDEPMEEGDEGEADRPHALSPAADSEGRDLPSRSSMVSEGELKAEGHISPHSSTCSTPVPTPPGSKSDFKPPNDYLSMFSQASLMNNYQPTTSSYSTSLMALEERVKAIEAPNPLYSYNSQRPLEQMANILRRQEGQITPPGGAGSSHSHSPGAASQPDLDSGSTSPANKDGASMGGSVSPNSKTSQGNSNSNSSTNPSKMEGESALFGFLPGMGMSPYKGFGALDLTPKPYGSGKVNTTCNICYKTFACRSALDIHYRSHTKDRPFKCEVCERSFSTKGNLKQHMLTHKIRDLPSEVFGTPDHMKSQENSPPAQKIDVTPPTTPTKEGPLRKPSIPMTPDGKTPITTTPPNSTLTTTNSSSSSSSSSSTTPPASMNTSPTIASSSSSESPFVRRPNLKHICQMCHKPFSSASALQIHIRTHTGDKPFKCTICGKAFTTKGNLKVHMGTHMWNNSPSRRGRRMSMDTLPGFPGVHTGVPPRPDEPHFFNNFPHRPPPHADMYNPFFPGFPNGFSPKMNEISVIQSINGNMNHMPGHPPTSEPMMARPPVSMAGSPKHPSIPATSDALMKPPSEIMMKSPIMKPEIKAPDFMMKEPHVIQPQEGSTKSESDSPEKSKVENNNNHPTNGATNNCGELDLSIHKAAASPISSPVNKAPSAPAPTPPALSPNLQSPHQLSPHQHSPHQQSPHQQSPETAAWMWKTTCHLCNKVCSSPGALEMHMKSHMPQHAEESSPKPLMT